MLLQLVCLDRRFQRMNCFNIREVEALLKTRFFADLVNSFEHREVLDASMIGLRFKTNDLTTVTSNMPLFHSYGILKNQSNRPVLNFFTSSHKLSGYEFYKSPYSNTSIFSSLTNSLKKNTILNFNLSLAEDNFTNKLVNVLLELRETDVVLKTLLFVTYVIEFDFLEFDILDLFYELRDK
jgi:hypothetical protein